MKKFTKIIICLLLCVVSLAFVGCDNRTPEEKAFTYPTSQDIIYGNGGYAVQKGNYLYYVNGFVGVEDAENVRNGNFTHGALMLMKFDDDGKIVTDEDNLLDDDYYITMSSRLCGFEATNLYISGDYLYFTTVCQEDEGGSNSGTWAKNRVDFCRIKLDKTGSVERVYVSETKYSEIEFEYYTSDNNTFILVHENGTYIDASANKSKTLVRVDCNAKTSTIIDENVSSVVLNDDGNKIFYVADNNSLYAYNIFGHKVTLYKTMESSAEVVLVGDTNVYVTYTYLGEKVLAKASNDVENKTGFEIINASVSTSASFEISELGDQVLMVDGNKITLIGAGKTIEDADVTEINVVGLANGCVIYYDEDNNLKSVSYSANEDIVTIAEALTFEDGYFDVSGEDGYMYYYKTVGSHKYLHRIKVVNTHTETEEMVGTYIGTDAEKVTTEDTEE